MVPEAEEAASSEDWEEVSDGQEHRELRRGGKSSSSGSKSKGWSSRSKGYKAAAVSYKASRSTYSKATTT